MAVVSHDRLQQFAAQLIEAVGSPSESAQVVASHLVSANMAGHDSHGVVRLLEYCQHAKQGYVCPQETPVIVRETPTTALVDGNLTWGAVVSRFAMNLAIEKATHCSISAVSVKNAHHVGRIGVYSAMAAELGYIGIVFCNVHGTARVAPWGGAERRLCTNPISMAIPAETGPIVVDFATSAVAEGKVRVAKLTGQEVPLGWVLDRHGEFSTNPNHAYDEGSLAPLGGDQGHKGYCLAVGLDLIGGVLSGAGCGQLSPNYGNGMMLQVIDPTVYCEREEFDQRLSQYVQYIKSARCREGVTEILMPGEKEERLSQQHRQDGLSIADEIWKQLEELGREFGVTA